MMFCRNALPRGGADSGALPPGSRRTVTCTCHRQWSVTQLRCRYKLSWTITPFWGLPLGQSHPDGLSLNVAPRRRRRPQAAVYVQGAPLRVLNHPARAPVRSPLPSNGRRELAVCALWGCAPPHFSPQQRVRRAAHHGTSRACSGRYRTCLCRRAGVLRVASRRNRLSGGGAAAGKPVPLFFWGGHLAADPR